MISLSGSFNLFSGMSEAIDSFKGKAKAAFETVSRFAAKPLLSSAAAMTAKAAVAGLCASFAAPAMVTMAGAALAGGIASSIVMYHFERSKALQKGEDAPKFFTKDRLFKTLLGSTIGFTGAAVVQEYGDQIISSLKSVDAWTGHRLSSSFNSIASVAGSSLAFVGNVVSPSAHAQPLTVSGAPIEASLPTPSAMEDLTKILPSQQLSPQVQDALVRAQAGNAQGMKDIAYHLIRGQGIDKNVELAARFYQQAAEAGNAQAIRDIRILSSMPEFKSAFSGLISGDTSVSAPEVTAAAAAPKAPALNLADRFPGLRSSLLADGTPNSTVLTSLARAENGSAQGVKDLAYHYLYGRGGVDRDLDRAFRLYQIAADAGNGQAIRDLDFLRTTPIYREYLSLPREVATCSVSTANPMLFNFNQCQVAYPFIRPNDYVTLRFGGESLRYRLGLGEPQMSYQDFVQSAALPGLLRYASSRPIILAQN